MNPWKRRRRKAKGAAKLRKTAAKELTKRSDSILNSLLDSSADEELKRIKLLYELAGESGELEEGPPKRRSIALELAEEPPWRPESAEGDSETADGNPEADDGHHS